MQVSATNNNYQMLQTQQQPVTLPIENPITTPVEPKDPIYSNKEIYDASQGNLIRGDDGELTLTPQGETNLNNAKEDEAAQLAAEAEANKASARETATNFLDVSSTKSQVEIYLAVATDGAYDSGNETVDVITNLRDIQKQNNAVQAYATYQESQNMGIPTLY